MVRLFHLATLIYLSLEIINEISGDTFFLSFVLKNLILIIKHNGKVNFHLFNRNITFHLSGSAKLKTCFSRKENLNKCTSFEEQKGIRRNVYFDIIVFIWLPPTKLCLKFLLICSARRIKGFYEILWGNEVDFTDMMYVSPKMSAQDQNFKKLNTETRLCRWKSNNYIDINIFHSVENPCTFLLAKGKTWKRIFKTNSKLLQNPTEKQFLPSKSDF